MTTLSHSNLWLHRMLTDQGACVHEHHPSSFEDIGDAENGPQLIGGPAYDSYRCDSHEFFIDRHNTIVARLQIDWDFWRFCESMPEQAPEDEQPAYVRKQHTGEDYIVWLIDTEDGEVWFACDDYGWTDKKDERGFFTKGEAQRRALSHNLTVRDGVASGRAFLEKIMPEPKEVE